MLNNLIMKKAKSYELSTTEYYEAIDYLMKNGINKRVLEFFLSLNSFGMSKKEVLSLTLAMRDSGKVLKFNQTVLEKHSTGGIGDSTSVVLIPLMSSLGYRMIKTTAKSFVFTNGTADRFGAIPNFKVKLTDEEIKKSLDKTNACVLSHDGDMCPADKYLFDIRLEGGIERDLNLLAASIASKKLASGANVVLVDVKYGDASLVRSYRDAIYLAKLLKYIFNKCEVKSVIEITNTLQTIGDGVGNAVELIDAINVLEGKKNFLRSVSCKYAVDLMTCADKKLNRDECYDLVMSALDTGKAYDKFLDIVRVQGGDVEAIKNATIFRPYHSINFKATKSGYIGSINSLLLGELIRRLCKESHDNNIGAVLHVKIGDYVELDTPIISFYYKDKSDFEKYKAAIAGSVRITDAKIKPIKILKKVIR